MMEYMVGYLAGGGDLVGRFYLINKGDDAGGGGHILASPLGMGEERGCACGCQELIGGQGKVVVEQGYNPFWAMGDLGNGGIQGVYAHHGYNQGGLGWDDGFVVGGGFDGAHPGAIGFDQNMAHGGAGE